MNKSPEIMWVHVLRILAIFCVVVVHSSAQIFFLGAKFPSYEWWVANSYDSSVRICISLLFMLTGFLLLGKSEPLGLFLKKRVHKVVVPLLIWSVIFVLWIDFYEYYHPSSASTMTMVEYLKPVHDSGWKILIFMLWCPVYFHLWFLYAVLGVYLVTPILRVVVQHADRKLLWYMVGLALLGFMLYGLQVATSVPNFIDLHMVGGNIGFVVLGYLLGTMTISRRMAKVMAVVVPVCALTVIIGTYYLTAGDKGVLNQTLWNSPLVLAMSAGVLIIARYFDEQCTRLQEGKLNTAIKTLSSASFGIYLVHVLFLYAFSEGLFGFRLTALSGNPAYFVPILVALTYTCSFTVIYIMQKIPYVRRAVP